MGRQQGALDCNGSAERLARLRKMLAPILVERSAEATEAALAPSGDQSLGSVTPR